MSEVFDYERAATSYRRARELIEADELEAAIELFRESVRAYPHFKALELLGECLLKMGRVRESIVPLAAAAGLNRGVRAAALLAEALADVGERDHAIDVAEEALRRDPSNRKAKLTLESLADHIASRSQ